jgi:hypothetical protein
MPILNGLIVTIACTGAVTMQASHLPVPGISISKIRWLLETVPTQPEPPI